MAGHEFTIEESAIANLAQKASKEQIRIERELGMRSFKHFFKMVWPIIDPASYVGNWHLDLLCDTMQQVAMRQLGDTVICVPPRSAKSLITSVAFPAWLWSWWPSCKVISASYDQRLASRDALKSRRLVESAFYKSRWGDKVQLVKDQNQKMYFQTVQGGHRWTSTPGMGVTGEGADFILFDDPHATNKAESAAERLQVELFWFESIPSRLNNPTAGRKLVIQQRVHQSDLAGQCMERGYHTVVLPALFEPDHPNRHPLDPRKIDGEPLWPARFRAEDYGKLMQELGPYSSASQYQQRPVAREGGLFNPDWFEVVDNAPIDLIKVRRWDFAYTAVAVGSDPDYTVGLLLGRSPSTKMFYILDIQRMRKSFGEVESRVKAVAAQDGKSVRIVLPIDPGAGKAQYEYFVKQLAGYAVTGEKEDKNLGNKAIRAQPVASQAEVGNFKMLRADWNRAFLEEMQMIPRASHDDQCDALSGAFRALLDSSGGMIEYLALQKREMEIAQGPEKPTNRVEIETNPWHALNT